MAKEKEVTHTNIFPETPTFSYESLRKCSRKLFGVSESTFDGATTALDKNGKYATNYVKNIIEKWLKGVCK
ncbi:hypothetical protein [Anaerovorax sp. IOR16]|uniref:hypothetical protein n=1 Tax=Anaerovorax sp. IOR16 TaxID=2773458 RepID=UPI0019D1B5E1|nr:hypothetical protein [Anaerovorax sp. IOR16]